MRDFCLYIDVDKTGKMDELQKEQFRILLNALTDRRINLYWCVDGINLKVKHLINVIKCFHAGCKGKGVLVHNEICASHKKVSKCARWLIGRLPLSLYLDERVCENDYAALKYGNKPDGCAFNSCLGNTAYLNRGAELTVCPYSKGIKLRGLKPGQPITEIFETEEFKSLLIRQIQKRNQCKADCSLFDLCHGGCPAQSIEDKCSVMENVEKQTDSDKNVREQNVIRLARLYRG